MFPHIFSALFPFPRLNLPVIRLNNGSPLNDYSARITVLLIKNCFLSDTLFDRARKRLANRFRMNFYIPHNDFTR